MIHRTRSSFMAGHALRAVPRLPGLAPGSAEGGGGGSLASIFEARPLARELHRSGRG